MNKKDLLISSIVVTILGILLVILKSSIISILFTILGALLIIYGIFGIFKDEIMFSIIEIIIGALIIVFSWVLVAICLVIIGVFLLFDGIFNLLSLIKHKVKLNGFLYNLILYFNPVFDIILGVMFIVNTFASADVLFIIIGIITIVDGLSMLFKSLFYREEKKIEENEVVETIETK